MGHPLNLIDRYLALVDELLLVRKERGPLSQDEEAEYSERLNDIRGLMTPEQEKELEAKTAEHW